MHNLKVFLKFILYGSKYFYLCKYSHTTIFFFFLILFSPLWIKSKFSLPFLIISPLLLYWNPTTNEPEDSLSLSPERTSFWLRPRRSRLAWAASAVKLDHQATNDIGSSLAHLLVCEAAIWWNSFSGEPI